MENKNTEIDLLELFFKILFYVKKYYWIFVVAIVLAIILSIFNSYFYKETYTSSILLKVNEGDKHLQFEKNINIFQKDEAETNYGELITRIIKTAETYRANGNFDVLSERMAVNVNTLNKIISIDVENNNLEEKPVSNYLTISVKSSDKKIFSNLGEGFINFINSNRFVKSKYEKDTKFLKDLKDEIDKKLSLNDKQSEDDIITKEKILLNLKNAKLVEIVEDFYSPKPSSYNIKKALAINIFISIFLSLLVVLVLVLNKKMKDYKL